MDLVLASNGSLEEAETLNSVSELDGESDSDELDEPRSGRLPSLSLLAFDEELDEAVDERLDEAASTCLR